jgi:large conductance mechanosensitive channel
MCAAPVRGSVAYALFREVDTRIAASMSAPDGARPPGEPLVIKEFKDFINRGNVLDLAVAVVLGAAFGAVVTSFVDDILMQVIAAIGGQPDFSDLTVDLGDAELRYGAFLNAVISFLLIAVGVFLVVKAVNALRREKDEEPAGPSETQLLTEIRDLLAERRQEP